MKLFLITILFSLLFVIKSMACEVRGDTIYAIRCGLKPYVLSNGKLLNATGKYFDTLISFNGCDSIITINLQVFVSSSSILITDAACDFYKMANNQYVYKSGYTTIIIPNYQGCDSVITYKLFIEKASVLVVDSIISCTHKNFKTPQGKIFNIPGTYYDTLGKTYKGCDSLIVYNLRRPVYTANYFFKLPCNQKTFIGKTGKTFSVPGFYTDTLHLAGGCDSILTYILSQPHFFISQYYNICKSSPPAYTPSGILITKDTMFQINYKTTNGCDSTINYVYSKVKRRGISGAACPKSPYVLPNGTIITGVFKYTDTVSSYLGCDSITNIDIGPKTLNVNILGSACDKLPYILPDGKVITGDYNLVDTALSYLGCDSITEIHIYRIVLTSNIKSFDTICSQNKFYILPNGDTTTISGFHTYTMSSHEGCDSIGTLFLQINPSNIIKKYVGICSNESITLPDGRKVDTSGTFIFSFQNKYKCDSIITIQVLKSDNYYLLHEFLFCEGDSIVNDTGLVIKNSATYFNNYKKYLSGCDSNITWKYMMRSPSIYYFPNDTILCYNIDGVEINPQSNNGELHWSTGEIKNTIVINDTGKYSVFILQPPCPTKYDTFHILFQNCNCIIVMPNTFTPNGDGENDLAIPQIPCANITHHFEFNIYNRWGEKLYTTFNLNEGWNGVYHGILQPQETYIYSIQYYIGNKKVKELLKGNISLLR